MTVIAYDGHSMAGDKRSTFGTTPVTTTKIMRAKNGALVGAAGASGRCRYLMEWYDAGADPKTYKEIVGDAQLLVVLPDKSALMYDDSPVPIRLNDSCVAIGSGMTEALVAMHCGKNSREAVEIASRFNNTCGNGVDELAL